MRKLGIFLIFLLTVPATAVAEDGRFFWGVMLGSTDFDIDGSDQIFVTTAQGRGGWDFLSWLGFEGRVLTSDSKSAAGVDDFNIRYMGSAYVKLSLPPKRNARAKFYVLGGYSGGRLEFEVAGVDDHISADGPSYGAGVEILANERNGLNIEWLRLVDGEENNQNYTIDQIGIGYVRRF